MSIRTECINFIVPIKVIQKKYPGGWEQCLRDYGGALDGGIWHDEYLFRDGAMNPMDIEQKITHWKSMGFKPTTKKNGVLHWADLCVYAELGGGSTLPCDWIVSLKDGRVAHRDDPEAPPRKRIRGTAVVIREGKVLLVRDKGKKAFSLPGGKVERGESSKEAAVRELYEELGMSARKAERVFRCDYQGALSFHKVSLIETDDDPKPDLRELEEYIWWDRVRKIPKCNHVERILKELSE